MSHYFAFIRLRSLAPLLIVSLMGLTACEQVGNITTRIIHASERDAYAASLRSADLENTALGKRWFEAAAAAKSSPTQLSDAQYSESGYFGPEEVRASAFSVQLQRGEQLDIKLQVQAQTPGKLFAQLYTQDGDGWAFEQSIATDGQPASVSADTDENYLIFLQPELLASLRYDLAIATGGSLAFPVQGKNQRAIGSVFGDPRDGGSRKHHGVDIFAKRGTPVVATTAGQVRRTGDTSRGGLNVWLSDADRSLSYYYAHLDSIAVTQGTRVKRGDVLGRVGNTGNARNTPPHLHFGIYARFSGPENPQAYLKPPPTTTLASGDELPTANPHRISATRLNLRRGPSTRTTVEDSLLGGTLVKLLAVSDGWYRISLADGREGYVGARWVEPAQNSLRRLQVNTAAELLAATRGDALAIKQLSPGTVNAYGRIGDYWKIKDATGREGWLERG